MRASLLTLGLALSGASRISASEPSTASTSGVPRLVLQARHSERISTTAFSPDGELVASADESGAIIISRVDSLLVVRDWAARRARATALAWSKDGSLLAAGFGDGSSCVYQTASGAVVGEFAWEGTSVEKLHWLNASRELIVSAKKGLRIVQTTTGAHREYLRPGTLSSALSDDERILACSTESAVVILDPANGNLLRSLPRTAKNAMPIAFLPGSDRMVAEDNGAFLQFTPADTELPEVVVRPDISIGTPKTPKPVLSVRGHNADAARILPAGDALFVVGDYPDAMIRIAKVPAAAFSEKSVRPRGYSFHEIQQNETWSKIQRDFALTWLPSVSVSPDGRFIAYSVMSDLEIARFGQTSGHRQAQPQARTLHVFQADYSEKERAFYLRTWDSIYRWRPEDGNYRKLLLREYVSEAGGLIRRWEHNDKAVLPINHETGQLVAYTSVSLRTNVLTPNFGKNTRELKIRLLNPGSFAEERQFALGSNGSSDDDFGVTTASADGSFLLVRDDKKFFLLDATKGVRGARVPLDPRGKCAVGSQGVLVAQAEGDTLELFNAATGTTSKLKGHIANIDAFVFNPDDTHLAVSHGSGLVRIWQLRPLAIAKEIRVADQPANFLLWGSRGRLLVGLASGKVQLLQPLANASPGAEYQGHPSQVTSATFFGNDDVATLDASGILHLWSGTTGKAFGHLSALGDGWAFVDPQGRYDTNVAAENLSLAWVMGDDPLRPMPIEIYQRQYFEPGLFAKLKRGENLPPLPALGQLNRAQPAATLKLLPATSQPAGDWVDIEVTVAGGRIEVPGHEPMETAAYDLQVFRDGQLVAAFPSAADLSAKADAARLDTDDDLWRSATEVPLGQPIPFRVRIPRGTNRNQFQLSAHAFNRDRVKGLTGSAQVKMPARTPAPRKAYLVLMGVSRTGDPAYNLSYAVEDVWLLKSRLEAALTASGEFTSVVTIPLVTQQPFSSEVNARPERGSTLPATKETLREVLAFLAGNPSRPENSPLRASPVLEQVTPIGPDDLLVFAIAAHGINSGSGDDLYLVPFDPTLRFSDTPLAEFQRRCISGRELASWLGAIDAAAIHVVVDACHAATAIESGRFKPAPLGGRSLGNLAYDKRMTVLTATQSDNVALGGGYGLLTGTFAAELLEMKGAMPRPFSLVEAMKRTAIRVPEIYRNNPTYASKGKPQEPHLFDFSSKPPAAVTLPAAYK